MSNIDPAEEEFRKSVAKHKYVEKVNDEVISNGNGNRKLFVRITFVQHKKAFLSDLTHIAKSNGMVIRKIANPLTLEEIFQWDYEIHFEKKL